MVYDARRLPGVSRQPYSVLCMVLSGANVYGFASPALDCDLHGVHMLPLHEMVGLG